MLRPFRERALFWCQVWKSAGRPLNTVLHNIMKRSRNIYHYEYRKCSKSEDLIRKNKILDSCINGSADLFEEIKAMRKCQQVTATSMDGVTEDIPGHFRSVYKQLYSSHDDVMEVADIEAEVENKINSYHILDVEKVTPKIVKEAASHLNSNKSDPNYSFSSDCIFLSVIKSLFQSFDQFVKPVQFMIYCTIQLSSSCLIKSAPWPMG